MYPHPERTPLMCLGQPYFQPDSMIFNTADNKASASFDPYKPFMYNTSSEQFEPLAITDDDDAYTVPSEPYLRVGDDNKHQNEAHEEEEYDEDKDDDDEYEMEDEEYERDYIVEFIMPV
jgi:hypothetical protein